MIAHFKYTVNSINKAYIYPINISQNLIKSQCLAKQIMLT